MSRRRDSAPHPDYWPRCFPVSPTTEIGSLPETPPIVPFAREQLGFFLDEHQAALLSCPGKRALLNCPRQWGKSSVAAVKAVHLAWFSPGSLVLAVGPSLRQSAELVLKVGSFLRVLGLNVPGNHGPSFRLKNGSRIVALPANEATTRGFSSVDLLLIDEAARVSDRLYRALRPMLAHGCGGAGGDLWLMSTPFGKRGFFWNEWANAGDTWFRLAVPATECPRFSPTFLQDERRSAGERWFAQEFLCEFHDAEGALFREELVRAAFRDDIRDLDL